MSKDHIDEKKFERAIQKIKHCLALAHGYWTPWHPAEQIKARQGSEE